MEMGHDYDEQNEKHQRHEAVDGLFNLFNKANNDLAMLHDRLDKEFKQIYPDNANPMKLVARIKKIQEEVSSLNEQCRELLAAKQDLIDKARVILVGNRSLLQRLQASTGVPVTDDSNDSAYTNFNQRIIIDNEYLHGHSLCPKIIEEWTVQVRSRTGDEKQESGPEDINHLLFSAIVPGN